jgi:hypothetical protein
MPLDDLPVRLQLLYACTVYISVTVLYESGKRLSVYAVKTQRPRVGWLHYEVARYGVYGYEKVEAKLLSDKGQALLVLDRARLVASKGQQGALIEGVEYRAKGRKHSIKDAQAWWCEAPPREAPLLDHAARVRDSEKAFDEQMAAWHSEADKGSQ